MAERRNLILAGASRGIGHATVRHFSEAGWRIIPPSREPVPVECQRDPNWTHHITADLGEAAGLDAFIAEANALLDGGPLHALVNNAGVSPKAPNHERLGCLNGDIAAWYDLYQLNFFAPLLLARRFPPAHAPRNSSIPHIPPNPRTSTTP